MKRWFGGAAAAMLMSGAVAAVASTYVTVTTVCPVDGELFSHQALASYTSFGSLPDGMPFGSVDFPVPLVECPDNGLVLYRKFEEAEVPALTRLVTSPDYQRGRETERSYYQAYRLAVGLGEEAEWLGSLLQAAWWQAKNARDEEQASRYGTAFVDWAADQPADGGTVPGVMVQLRRVNALRELGRFAEAEAVRQSMPPLSSDADLPDGAREQLMAFARRLGPPIAREDASRSPIDLLPAREAALRCLDRGEMLSADEGAFCDAPDMADTMASVRQMRADLKRFEEEAARDAAPTQGGEPN